MDFGSMCKERATWCDPWEAVLDDIAAQVPKNKTERQYCENHFWYPLGVPLVSWEIWAQKGPKLALMAKSILHGLKRQRSPLFHLKQSPECQFVKKFWNSLNWTNWASKTKPFLLDLSLLAWICLKTQISLFF